MTPAVTPRFCHFYLTYRCDLTCEHCGIWKDRSLSKIKELPFESAPQILKNLKSLGVRQINFTGGEPLLHPELPRILLASKQLGITNWLTTSGTGYLPQAHRLKGLTDHLFFSLDAPAAEEHDRIRGKACFTEAVEGITLARRLGERPRINFTVSRLSLLDLPEMVALAESLRVPLVINPVFDFYGLEGFAAESLTYLYRYLRSGTVMLNLAGLEFIKRGGNAPRRPRCRAAEQTLTVSPEGSLIFPCFYYPKEKINLNGNLKNFYRSAAFQRIRESTGRGRACEGCFRWDYILPSFGRRLDKYFLLNLVSGIVNAFKLNLKR